MTVIIYRPLQILPFTPDVGINTSTEVEKNTFSLTTITL